MAKVRVVFAPICAKLYQERPGPRLKKGCGDENLTINASSAADCQ